MSLLQLLYMQPCLCDDNYCKSRHRALKISGWAAALLRSKSSNKTFVVVEMNKIQFEMACLGEVM